MHKKKNNRDRHFPFKTAKKAVASFFSREVDSSSKAPPLCFVLRLKAGGVSVYVSPPHAIHSSKILYHALSVP